MFKKICVIIVVILSVYSLLGTAVFASGSKKIVKDVTTPIVKLTFPKNNQTEVNINSTISISFSEEIVKGKTFSDITLIDLNGNDIGFTTKITKNILRIKPKASLKIETKYTIILPVACITDISKNAMKKESEFKFVTGKNDKYILTPLNPSLDENITPTKVQYFSMNESSPWMIESFKYENGIKVSGTGYNTADSKHNTIMKFDENGKLLDETIYYDSDQKQLAKKRHVEWSEEYQLNRLVTPDEWEPMAPKPEEQNIYDDNGKLVESRCMFAKKTIEHSDYTVTYEFLPQDISYYTYDSSGSIAEKRTWRDPGTFELSKEFIYKYKYDDIGNIIEEYVYYDGKFYDKIKYTYTYDDQGRIEEVIQLDLLGGSPVIPSFTEADEAKAFYSRTQFNYDQDSNLIETIEYDRANEIILRKTYQYK